MAHSRITRHANNRARTGIDGAIPPEGEAAPTSGATKPRRPGTASDEIADLMKTAQTHIYRMLPLFEAPTFTPESLKGFADAVEKVIGAAPFEKILGVSLASVTKDTDAAQAFLADKEIRDKLRFITGEALRINRAVIRHHRGRTLKPVKPRVS